jgi:hypothetical protein
LDDCVAWQAVADELEDLYRGLEVARASLVRGEAVVALGILGRVRPRFEWLTKHAADVARGHERLSVPASL